MNLETFEKKVINKIELADYNSALILVQHFIKDVISSPLSVANVFGSRQLDNLCLAVGEAVSCKNSINHSSNNGPIVFVATELGAYGGHTHVIKDLINAQLDRQYIILLTDLYNKVDIDGLIKGFNSIASIQRAPIGEAVEKLNWLHEKLVEISPSKIFLFNHHEDSVAIASIQPWLKLNKVIFYHHADHHLCLGVHLPNATHIDPHNLGYYNCKTHECIRNNHYLPLVTEDRGIISKDVGFIKDGSLRTCSSGTSIKFDSSYIYPYKELVAKRLELRQGVHFHIGDLPTSMLAAIQQQLQVKHVELNRFIHIPWVSNLWIALKEYEIDMYISSFPLGGGRATIEAMGAGIPLMMHESSMSRFHGGVDIAYPGAFVWNNPTKFYELLENLSPTLLENHSKISRIHYEKYHKFSLLKEQLSNIISGKEGLKPPDLGGYMPDYLQRYLQLNIFTKSKYDKDIELILSSNSWKFTKPIRWISSFIKDKN